MRLPRRPVCGTALLALAALGGLTLAHPDAVAGRTVALPAPAAVQAPAVQLPAPTTTAPAAAAPAVAAPKAPVAAPRTHPATAPAAPRGAVPVPPRAAAPAAPAAPAAAPPAAAAVAPVARVAAAAPPAAVVQPAAALPGELGPSDAPSAGPRLYVDKGVPPLLPGGRTQFGMSVYPRGDETAAQAVARLRAQYGSLPVVRVFSPGLLPARWTDEPTLAALGAGSSVVYSFKADPRQVAAGVYDDRVRGFLAGRPVGVRAYVAFFHEPEDDVESGAFTTADFRAATAHLAPIVRSTGALPTTILMQYTLSPTSHRDWHDYYSPQVDVLAWDAYNTSAQDRVPSYRPVAGMVAPVLAVARETGKAYGWAELGSPCLSTDPTCAGRAAWLASLGTGLSAAGAQFATYWNRPNVGGFDYSLTDAASATAWAATMR